MAKKKALTWQQRLREQPVIAYKLVGALVSAVLAYAAPRFGFDLPPELAELVVLGWLLALGVDVPVTVAQWRAVSPTAKLDRLEAEGKGAGKP